MQEQPSPCAVGCSTSGILPMCSLASAACLSHVVVRNLVCEAELCAKGVGCLPNILHMVVNEGGGSV